MRFGNILIVLIIIFSVAINHNHFYLKLVVAGQQQQYHQFNFQHNPEQHRLQEKSKQIDDNDIDNNRWSLLNRKTNLNINRRIFSLLPTIYNRQSVADRRLLFSFNQLLLSLVAPRLMRYQFDLMMHSVVSELFRKIFVPAIGTSIKGAGIVGSTNQQSILSPLSNLLRNNNNNNHQIQNNNPTTTSQQSVQHQQHYHQYQQQQQQQLSPHPTSSAPNLDLQRLLDNAQKLIALQTLIRNGQTTTTTTTTIKPNNDNELKVFDEKKAILNNLNNKDSINNNNSNQKTAAFDNVNSYEDSSGKSNSKSNQHQQQQQQQPIHLAISPTDFIDFVRNNWKQNHQIDNNNNEYSSTPITAYSNNNNLNPNIPIEQDFHINQKLKPSFLQNNQGNGNDGGNIDKMKSSSANNSNSKKRKRFKFYKQKAKLEDFKMSHLTYIDTEVPNYGNQMLINHLDDNNNSASQEQENFKHSPTDQSKNVAYHSFFEMPGRNQESAKKSNEDYERANRWNNVLSNIKRFG